VIITLLGLLGAGCSPKELPDWAVTPASAPARANAARMVEPQARDRGPPPHVTPTMPQADLLPFTPAWQAREEEFDKRLRRTMDICRGC
jgi:hypothetical protein